MFLSAVSAWEIALKYRLGKLRLDEPPGRYVPDCRSRHGIQAIALAEEAALIIHRLPSLHRDPFDRMLVCQAILHGMTVLTPDPMISRYPITTAW